MTAAVLDAETPAARSSVVTSIVEHLWPGVLAGGAYAAAAPLAQRFGAPPLMTLTLVVLLILPPIEFGRLLLAGRRMSGRWSIWPAIGFRGRLRGWQCALAVALAIVGALVFYALAAPADAWVLHRLFGWLPPWFLYGDVRAYAHLSRRVLIWTFGLRLLADGFILPVAEELYFRGYLLPRLAAPGWLAPILSAALFAAYHVWQPYNWPTIFVFLLPMCVLVQRFRDVRIAIFTHMALNLIGFAAFLAAVARA